MKDLREILFNKMQPSKIGGVEIDTAGILEAMEEAAKDRAVAFALFRDSKHSRFELERYYDIFIEREPF